MRRVQLRVGVGAVPVARPARAEHHAATLHGALVHLAQVHRAEVDFQGTLVAEGLETHVALHAFLAGGGIDEGRAEIGRHIGGRTPLTARPLARRVRFSTRDTGRSAERGCLQRQRRWMTLLGGGYSVLRHRVASAEIQRVVRVLVLVLLLLRAEFAALLAAAVHVRWHRQPSADAAA